MKNEIILKYLDDQLSETEKSKFEKELTQNKELRNEYQKMREKMERLKRISQIQANSAYFDELNEKLTSYSKVSEKPKWLPIYLVPLTSAVVVLFVLFILLFQNNSKEFIEFTDSDIEAISKYESRSLLNESNLFSSDYNFFDELNLDEVQNYYYENFISDFPYSKLPYSS